MRGCLFGIFLGMLAAAMAGPSLAAGPGLTLMAHDTRTDRAAAIDSALAISRLDAAVDISGHMAQTTLTVTFANPTKAVLEGDFSLDLPAGASVTGYALDVQGVMTEGVLMPRFQAREAYEEKLRQGVDPGLAEVGADNRFRTHVFPIRAGSGRTIRVTYVTPLGPDGRIVVPVTTDTAVGSATVAVTARGQGGPLVTLDGVEVRATGDGDVRVFNAQASDHRFGSDLTITGLAPAAPLAVMRHSNGEKFFELIVDAEPEGRMRARSVRLYWDASRSRREQDTAAEAKLVADYVRRTKPAALDLVVFSDGAPKTVHFAAPDGDAVLKTLSAISYSGATRFEGLKTVLPGRADVCLIVSDGAVSLGDPDVGRWPCRVLTLSSAKAARRDVLGQLAARNGGQYADLSVVTPEAALGLLTQRAPAFSDVTDGDGETADVVVSPLGDGRYRLVGPVPGDGRLDVITRAGDAYYDFGRLPVSDNDGAGALWGRSQIDRLSVAPAPDKDAILAVARRYHVATPDLSFVVFERGRDYAEAEVAPPADAPVDVLAEYKVAREDKANRKAQEKARRFDSVLTMWTEQKAWWASKPLTLAQAKARLAEEKKPKGDVLSAVPPPPAIQPRVSSPVEAVPEPPMPVRAMAKREARFSDSDQMVVVTGMRAPGHAGDAPSAPQIEVTSAEWNPDRPYFRDLAAVKDGDRPAFDAAFAAIEAKYGDTPGFYFDIAERMFRHHIDGAAAMARNAIEVPGADIDTSIILASRLLRYGDGSDAVWLDEHVARLTPEKPQAARNLALAVVEATDARLKAGTIGKDAAVEAYEHALELLAKVVLTPWDSDYDGIEIISLMEANHLAAKLRAMGADKAEIEDILPARLTTLLDVDVRVTLEWNTDHTDMDLWVDEPSGERAIYSHPKTLLGGRLSNDMTQGYGPEEYLLRFAPAGDYKVLANIYAADVLNRNGGTSVTVHLYRDWGRPTERVETFVTELKKEQGEGAVPVGSFRKK